MSEGTGSEHTFTTVLSADVHGSAGTLTGSRPSIQFGLDPNQIVAAHLVWASSVWDNAANNCYAIELSWEGLDENSSVSNIGMGGRLIVPNNKDNEQSTSDQLRIPLGMLDLQSHLRVNIRPLAVSGQTINGNLLNLAFSIAITG